MGDVFSLQALARYVILFAQTAGGKEYETVTVDHLGMVEDITPPILRDSMRKISPLYISSHRSSREMKTPMPIMLLQSNQFMLN